tara:strand:- start:92 stop:400 length:309 start_codon:yes stop_codon:yes gene_type:complete
LFSIILNSSIRSFLRSKAHHLEPVLQIGKKGLNASVLDAIDKALYDHELIKIKFREYKGEKDDLAEKIISLTSCSMVGKIGHTIILFRQNKNIDKRKINLPE